MQCFVKHHCWVAFQDMSWCYHIASYRRCESKTANCQEEARTDIHVRRFCEQWQSAFFDIKVFHPNALSYCNTSVPSLNWCHEAQKKGEYDDRVREVERESFILLVFSTNGCMGREAIVFYGCLADYLSHSGSTSYNQTLAFIRCTLSFSLKRSATMCTCIRGSKSILHCSSDASLKMGYIHRDY